MENVIIISLSEKMRKLFQQLPDGSAGQVVIGSLRAARNSKPLDDVNGLLQKRSLPVLNSDRLSQFNEDLLRHGSVVVRIKDNTIFACEHS
jgi:hypothetical protein